jgi:hypothetical protein
MVVSLFYFRQVDFKGVVPDERRVQGKRMKPLHWAIKGHKRDVGTRFCVSA